MNRRRSLLLVPLLALTLGAFAQDTAETGSHARIVRISYLEGTVQYNGAPAVMNSPVTENSRLVTGTDGVAEVEFEDHSAIRVASESQISFAQLARLSSGEAMTRVDLEDGEAEFLIPGSSAGRFAVNVRGKNILFTEAGRFRILSTHATPLEVVVWKGEAEVRDLQSGKEVTVKARETFALNPENLEQYNIEDSVLADDLDRWSEQRDRDLRTNYVVSNTYNNPVDDQFYQTGGYGYAAPGAYPYGLYGYDAFGCAGGFGQPFWFGSPGFCGNSGFFFSPFFNPFFFSPVVVIVRPPIRPRRPPIIHPPAVAGVAKVGTGNTVARPGFHSFLDQPRTGIKPGESTPGQSGVIETVAPGGSMPVHAALPGSRPQHGSAPPARPPSRSFSGSRGPSGGFSHASAPAHASGRGR